MARKCGYWKDNLVKTFTEKEQYISSTFDGCCYGLKSNHKRYKDNGQDDQTKGELMLIKKPWKIMMTKHSPQFQDLLNDKCDETHLHATCEGKDTKSTENYTWEIAKRVHDAFRLYADNLNSSDSLEGIPRDTTL